MQEGKDHRCQSKESATDVGMSRALVNVKQHYGYSRQVQDCRESLRLREDSATRPILEKGSWKPCLPNAALKHHCPKRRTPCGALTTTKHVNHTPVRGADQAVG